MKIIDICASRSYQVIVGEDLLSQLGSYASAVIKPCKAAIISDSHVWPLHGSTAEASLRESGFETVHFVFPAGEEQKNASTYLEILNFLAENKMTRSDVIIALGGGVVGDISGFAAATYLRGISYIQVPTSLLAMVDSSVGGKTAIDLSIGKNLVGAFYQPILVLCDMDCLQTLPKDIFRDGCAEVIKYGVLYDRDLFEHLSAHGLSFDREAVIARCVELKRDVVAQDEFDTGARQKLNLGHTVGHSIEALSQFTVSHGQAVAMGMGIIARAAAARDICTKQTSEQICSVLEKFTLPVKTQQAANALYQIALSDKKRSGGTVNLIIPEAIGSCIIQKIPVGELECYIKDGL